MKLVYDWHKNFKGKIIKDIKYKKSDSNRNKLDIFVPDNKTGPVPIIINFHGGGLIFGNKKDAYGTCKYFADQGYLVINIGYRLSPKYKFPVQLQDAADAIYWTYKNAQQYGGDENKIFLTGDSAGAYLASWYTSALHKNEMFELAHISKIIPKENVKGSLYFYGVFDWKSVSKVKRFFDIKRMAKSLFGSQIPDYSSPLKNISDNQSPVFITSSKRDRIHGQSAAYSDKLKEKKVPTEVLFFKKCNHGFLGHGYTDCCKKAVSSAVKFVEKYSE